MRCNWCGCFHAPEHFVQFVGRHAATVVRKTEAQLFSERHHIYPDVLGCDARVRCIIYDENLDYSNHLRKTYTDTHNFFLSQRNLTYKSLSFSSLKLQAVAK